MVKPSYRGGRVVDGGAYGGWSTFGYDQKFSFFFFNDTATTEIYTLSLHDALPIYTDYSKETNNREMQSEIIRKYGKFKAEHSLRGFKGNEHHDSHVHEGK